MNSALDPRRGDLDALRAAAMLLGILLHAGLSFTPFLWPVQDERQSGFYGLLFAAIHGFRMPVFFLLSGFFTAMLWRNRGMKSMLSHRFRRVLLPLLLGLVTIVPAVNWISGWAMASAFEADPARAGKDSIWNAARNGDLAAMGRHLGEGADVDVMDPASGLTPLVWAVLEGRAEAVDWLLENGAAVNGRTRDGGTSLHAAAFLGRAEIARLLLRHGADPEAKNHNGDAPRAALEAGWELTRYLAGLLRIEIDEGQVEAGRVEIAALLGPSPAAEVREETGREGEGTAGSRFVIAMAAPVFSAPVFHHLWFLWFLWWLVLLYALGAGLAGWMKWPRPPEWLVLSPVRFLWLIPLTVIPQSLMGLAVPSFGPDASIGLLPMPHVLLYYAPLFRFRRLVFRLRRPGRQSGEMVVAGPSLGAVGPLSARARILNGLVRIPPGDTRPGHGPGRGGGVAGRLPLDHGLWLHWPVPQTLRPRKQYDSLCIGFVVLAVCDARAAYHRRSVGGAGLAASLGAEVRPGDFSSHRPSVAGLPVPGPLFLAGKISERSPRSPCQLLSAKSEGGNSRSIARRALAVAAGHAGGALQIHPCEGI